MSAKMDGSGLLSLNHNPLQLSSKNVNVDSEVCVPLSPSRTKPNHVVVGITVRWRGRGCSRRQLVQGNAEANVDLAARHAQFVDE